jgi:hypothetical protein
MSKKINNEKNTFDNMNFDQKFIRELKKLIDDSNKQYVTKINGAVVADEDHAGLDLYYVDEQDIEI